jgi:hypothetical protein
VPQTTDFKDFIGAVKPLVTGAPQPQLYETDLSPVKAFESPLTEIFRIPIGSGGNDLSDVRKAWDEFVAVILEQESGVLSLSGTSLNLEERLFLGILGWPSVDVSCEWLCDFGGIGLSGDRCENVSLRSTLQESLGKFWRDLKGWGVLLYLSLRSKRFPAASQIGKK